MNYNKIVLAGGNGYLGQVLAHYYRTKASEVIILSRHKAKTNGNVRTILWDGKTEGAWTRELEGSDLLINLCGKNVNCRYTKKNKKEIFASRLIPTTLLGLVIAQLPHPPALWINVTSATIYRHAEDRPQDEYDGEVGEGFSVDVCKRWEETFFNSPTPQTRKVALRMGIVFGPNDGAFPRLRNLVRAGLGGKMGNGKQYISWIHEQDVAQCTDWLLQHPEITGVVNCTAPQSLPNAVLMKWIRRTTRTVLGLPSPAWLLKLGAILIDTETELILKSRWVGPSRLIDAGYPFLFPGAEQAVRNILGK